MQCGCLCSILSAWRSRCFKLGRDSITPALHHVCNVQDPLRYPAAGLRYPGVVLAIGHEVKDVFQDGNFDAYIFTHCYINVVKDAYADCVFECNIDTLEYTNANVLVHSYRNAVIYEYGHEFVDFNIDVVNDAYADFVVECNLDIECNIDILAYSNANVLVHCNRNGVIYTHIYENEFGYVDDYSDLHVNGYEFGYCNDYDDLHVHGYVVVHGYLDPDCM